MNRRKNMLEGNLQKKKILDVIERTGGKKVLQIFKNVTATIEIDII